MTSSTSRTEPSHRTRRRNRAFIVFSLFSAAVIAVIALIAKIGAEDTSRPSYFSERSPDGRFEIVVIDNQSVFSLLRFAMPGQGGSGESAGMVILRDTQGRELARAPVDMKQSIPGGIIWTPKRVSVVATDTTWTLPDDATPSLGQ